MSCVFISHSSEDKPFVRELAKNIRQCGLTVWFDEWDMRVGAPITSTLTDSIDKSKWVIVVLSPAALTSHWVESEWRYACKKEAQDQSIKVILLLLKPCIIPAPMANNKYADFTNSYSDGFYALMETIAPQELLHREYTFLRGRRMDIGRRGFSVSDGPQRIMTLLCGGEQWAVSVLFETVGPRDSAVEASGLAMSVMHKYLKEFSGELDPEYVIQRLVASADTSLKYVRQHNNLPETTLGGKCAFAVQANDALYVLSLGQTSIVCRWKFNTERVYLRSSSAFECRLQPNVVNPGFALDNPVGFFADRQLRMDIKTAVFASGGDIALLTSHPLPNDDDGYGEFCTSIHGITSGKDITLQVCRSYAPPVVDYMAVTFSRL
jgi:TIR domain-containing protein